MDWRLFLSIFVLICLVELPGKTTFASLLMSSRATALPVFFGACGAFVIHTVIAVMAGRLIGLLPARPAHVAVGLIFLVLAILMWREKQEEIENYSTEAQKGFWKTVGAAFIVIFIAQWGDPTQLATAALAAKFPSSWVVFLAATSALWTVTGLAVIVGHFAKKNIHPKSLKKVVSLVFAGVGLVLLIQAF